MALLAHSTGDHATAVRTAEQAIAISEIYEDIENPANVLLGVPRQGPVCIGAARRSGDEPATRPGAAWRRPEPGCRR